jgi:hypothetical protein
MANIELLISKLDRRLKSLHQEQSLVNRANKIGSLEQGLLSEYIRLTIAGGIIPGIEFIILDSLSKHFNLYEDNRERQQILVAMVDEIKDSATADISASIQVIRNAYPSIYLLTQQKLILIRVCQVSTIVRVLKEPETRSRLVIGSIAFCAAIFGAILSTNLNRPLSYSSSNANENPQTLAPLVQATNQNNTPLPTQTSNPTQTTTPQRVPIEESSPVVTEDKQSRLSLSAYQSQCTFLSNHNESENIIDDKCNIAQTTDQKNYTIYWSNSGTLSNIEIITDSQAIIDGEQAKIVDKNSSGITISFSKGRIGWYLKQ